LKKLDSGFRRNDKKWCFLTFYETINLCPSKIGSKMQNCPDLAPPWNSPEAWREANQSVDHLVQLHRPQLNHLLILAYDIRVLLESIFPLLDELCTSTCPWCPDPCCWVATVWIDFTDLLFLHLCGQQIPSAQPQQDLKKTCRYFGPRGCTLPRITRPWCCTWYMCASQLANLHKKDPPVQNTFRQAIQTIRNGRKEMEEEFIRLVSRNINKNEDQEFGTHFGSCDHRQRLDISVLNAGRGERI